MQFLRSFLASLLALTIFFIVMIFVMAAWFGGLAVKNIPKVANGSVLVVDLGQHFREQETNPGFAGIITGESSNVPGLYDVVRLINHAANDKRITGIYLIANNNPNGFAGSNEIRTALLDFRDKGKFILAHGDVVSQTAYYVASVADSVYASPAGYFSWNGLSVDLFFLKGLLDKLEIEPQVFYAGKYKSATEIFRTTEMTPENKEQTSAWVSGIYSNFLSDIAESRGMDTAELRRIANTGIVYNAKDAYRFGLIDGLRYDDELKDEIRKRLSIDKYHKIPFISINDYSLASRIKQKGKEEIALIYAEGDIVDGEGLDEQIGSHRYRSLIRKARLDRNIKAIVFRINSGGGSTLASENIWRELSEARKEKPVIISFGEVAASGGYYIACAGDSVFTGESTITGSIGVFGIIPNMQGFFNNKLGITFDGVRTSPFANTGAIYRPLTEAESRMIQAQIDQSYQLFLKRVAEARKMSIEQVDSIAQGRVWTGEDAVSLGLADRIGTLEDAIKSAAAMAGIEDDYKLREYPTPRGFLQKLLGSGSPSEYRVQLKKELGEEQYRIFTELQRIQEMTSSYQARIPFEFVIR